MRLFYLSIMLLLCVSLQAQKSIQVFKDSKNNFRIENSASTDFRPYINNNNGLENGSYWFRIYHKSNEASVLHVPSPHLNNAKLFTSSGSQIKEIANTRFPSFYLDEFESYPLYLYADFDKEAYFPIEISSPETFNKENQQALFKLGLYFGFALMVIIINLMCFVLFDEKVFLYYCAVLTTLTLSFFYSDGLFRLFGFDGVFVNTYLEPLLHISVALFAAYFATKFLRLEESFPKLKWITAGLIVLAGIAYTVYWTTGSWTYAAIGKALTWGTLLNYLIAGTTLFRQKVYARFYVVAYSLLFLLLIDYYVLSAFGVSLLNVTTFQLKIAGALEMLVLTYAIMYRMKALKEENELMQVEMRLYLKRIELLRSPDNIKMVDELYMENLVEHYDLNNLETKLLQYISKGKDNNRIAIKLNISVKEVEKMTKALYKKLEIHEQILEDQKMVGEQPDYIYN